MKQRVESKLLSIIIAILTGLVILTGSIAVPILCRPFYYAHITPLQMRLRVMLTEPQVKETYDEIMNYCLGFTNRFELTHLSWSEAGASHFADVRNLFLLDLAVGAGAIILLAVTWTLSRRCHVKAAPIKGHSPGFWAAAGLGTAFVLLGAFAAVDFDGAFKAFHTVFFPGKENWIFDEAFDPVIKMLPQVFFRNCALLVLGLILTACILLILKDRYRRK